MLMRNYIRSRKSVREFKPVVSAKNVAAVKALIEEKNAGAAPHGVTYMLIEDGATAAAQLKGHGGYSGVMIEAPMYIAMQTENEEDAYVYGAYHLEDLITKLEELNMGTCWVTVEEAPVEVKQKAFGYETGTVDYVLAIGHPAPSVPTQDTPCTSKIAEDYV